MKGAKGNKFWFSLKRCWLFWVKGYYEDENDEGDADNDDEAERDDDGDDSLKSLRACLLFFSFIYLQRVFILKSNLLRN